MTSEHEKAETALQMAQRHVNEGQKRIARQEALIAELVRDGHDHMLPEANDLLRRMQEFQAEAEQHVAQRLAESAGQKTD